MASTIRIHPFRSAHATWYPPAPAKRPTARFPETGEVTTVDPTRSVSAISSVRGATVTLSEGMIAIVRPSLAPTITWPPGSSAGPVTARTVGDAGSRGGGHPKSGVDAPSTRAPARNAWTPPSAAVATTAASWIASGFRWKRLSAKSAGPTILAGSAAKTALSPVV